MEITLGITIPISNGRRQFTRTRSRVLIVDQHPLVGGVLCEGLAELGYEAVHCSSAEAALRVCRTGRIDTVLTEVGLLTEAGERLTSRLRRELPQIALVLLTAWFDHPEAGGQADDGVQLVLQKPIQLKQLDRALRGLSAGPRPVAVN